jgi:hypothetical protein
MDTKDTKDFPLDCIVSIVSFVVCERSVDKPGVR